MRKKTVALLALLLILSIGGCGKKEGDANGTSSSQSRSQNTPPAGNLQSPVTFQKLNPSTAVSSKSSAPTKKDQETALMKKMGLQVRDGQIILDTEKSRKFFESLGRSIKENIHHGVKKAEEKMPSGEDLGIHVDDKKVVIDLNRTKNFMKEWVETMEVLGRELNRSLAPLQP